MMNQLLEGFPLDTKFVHLTDNGEMNSVLVDEKFWSKEPDRAYLESGRLLGVLNLDPGPSHWEIHPDGDELLYLLAGSMEIVIESEGQHKTATLAAPSSCIVPQETWHQTIALEPCRLLFITPSKDTHYREQTH